MIVVGHFSGNFLHGLIQFREATIAVLAVVVVMVRRRPFAHDGNQGQTPIFLDVLCQKLLLRVVLVLVVVV